MVEKGTPNTAVLGYYRFPFECLAPAGHLCRLPVQYTTGRQKLKYSPTDGLSLQWLLSLDHPAITDSNLPKTLLSSFDSLISMAFNAVLSCQPFGILNGFLFLITADLTSSAWLPSITKPVSLSLYKGSEYIHLLLPAQGQEEDGL